MRDYEPTKRCPKCGYDCVTTKHVPRHNDSFWYGGRARTVDPRLDVPEHLLRTCVRCNYNWRENVLTVHEVSVKTVAD